jgi:hypothetical protein
MKLYGLRYNGRPLDEKKNILLATPNQPVTIKILNFLINQSTN